MLATLTLAALTAGLAIGGNGETNKKTFEYEVGLWGDLPYSDGQASSGVPNLIADMNDAQLEFTVHDGDLKAGNGTVGSTTPTVCSDALYVQGLAYLNALDGPAMFTPGDNDWTDCDRHAGLRPGNRTRGRAGSGSRRLHRQPSLLGNYGRRCVGCAERGNVQCVLDCVYGSF